MGKEAEESSELERSDEEIKVDEWRHSVILKLGFPEAEARNLAARRDVDLHELSRLIKNGCSLELALEIVG